MGNLSAAEELRAGIRVELPELAQIKDDGLREKVVEAWALSLGEWGFKSISELRGSGAPNLEILRRGTQVDHLRGVALLAMRIADQLTALYPELPVNRDVLIAGALLHDVGKPLEFNEDNQRQWEQRPRAQGWPPTRHSVNGWYICRAVGLPLEVAHIPAGHSKEGEFIVRSLECTIVYFADQLFWNVLKAGGLLLDSDVKWVDPWAKKS